jgi:hypothetical protein
MFSFSRCLALMISFAAYGFLLAGVESAAQPAAKKKPAPLAQKAAAANQPIAAKQQPAVVIIQAQPNDGNEGEKQNGQAGDQGEKQNGQAGDQGEKQNGQAGDQGEKQNGQKGDQGGKNDEQVVVPQIPNGLVQGNLNGAPQGAVQAKKNLRAIGAKKGNK